MVGSAPSSTCTDTDDEIVSPSIFDTLRENWYDPAANVNDPIRQEHAVVAGGTIPQLAEPAAHAHEYVKTALGSSGSAVAQASTTKAESVPTVRSPPPMPPASGSSRSPMAVSAMPQTLESETMQPVARSKYRTPAVSVLPAT
jgi:hypothetical protein